MVSSCPSSCLRSTCPGCGWRNTPTRTVRSVHPSASPPRLLVRPGGFLKPPNVPSAGLHAGFLPRLRKRLHFSGRRGRPVAGHIRVHEGGVSAPGPQNRPAGPQKSPQQLQTQRCFIWHRLVFVRLKQWNRVIYWREEIKSGFLFHHFYFFLAQGQLWRLLHWFLRF